MKRKLTLVVCVVVAIAMMFTLASCGGDDHSHSYDTTKWSSNEYGHWYAATCGCEGETSNYGAHVDADKNGVCDTCAFVTCEHTYETEWQSDETKHWNNSSCGCNVKGSYEDHVDENKDGICDTCDYVVCSHTYDDKWSSDGENHWHAASCGCDVVADKAAHVDAAKDGVCDVCEYVICTHTYAKEWSSDGAYHWYAATCGCNVIDKKAEHVDADKNGVCEICNGTACAHTYAEEWSSDETGHWYAATCGCSITDKFAAHTPKVGETNTICEICEYVICAEHTYAEEWSSDETSHWNDSSCGCAGIIANKADHADEDKDGICDTCEYVVCAHTWSEETIKSEGYHWNNPTCGCKVSNKAEHVDEDADGACDVCTYKSAVKDAVNSLDSTASNNTNSTETIKDKGATESYTSSYTYVVLDDGRLSLYNGYGEEQYMYVTLTDGVPTMIDDVYGAGESVISPVEGKENVYSYTVGIYTYYITVYADSNVVDVETVWSMEKNNYYKVYDNYFVVSDIYGNVKYYSYYGTDGEFLFVMSVDEYGNVNRETDVSELGAIASYNAVYWNVQASNHEDFIKGLYNLGVNGTDYGASYGFVGAENEGAYSFSYLYVEDGMYFVVKVSYTVDANENGIATASVSITNYGEEDVTVDASLDTYTVLDEAEADGSETYEITQAFGAPMDSTSNPNPYPASNYIVTDFTLTDGTNVYEDGDEIELDAMEELALNFNAEIADKIGFNIVTATATTSDGTELSSWSSQGTINVNTWADPLAIEFVGKQADTFTIVIDVEGTTLTLTAKVNYLTPDSIDSVVYDEDDEKVITSEYTIYRGQALKITASVAAGCNPAYTATLPQGVAATLTDNDDGTWTFTPTTAGEFEITLTSTAAAGVSTVLTVTVAEPPAISDVLNGTHTGENMYSGLTVGATFTPSEEGAETGTVVVTVNGTVFNMFTYEWETVEYSATYTYAYNEETDAIELTYVEGDEFEVELLVNNYKVVAIYEFNEYKLVKEEQEPTTPAGDPTESPITVTMTGAYTYCYDYTFTFVAGDAGYYTFTVPSGFGVMSEADYQNYGSAYVDFQTDDGGTFTIQLSEGASFALRFGSLEAKDYELSFTYSATDPEGGNAGDTTTGLEGTYTAADNFDNTFDVVITGTTITFTPAGATDPISYTYQYANGAATYFDSLGVQITMGMQFSLTITDGEVTGMTYNGTGYTLTNQNSSNEDDDNNQGSVEAITGNGSEENPFVIAGAGSTMISANKFTPLFVKVNAGVTVTLPAGAQFYTDPTDTTTAVGATVTPDVDTLYYVYADSMAGCMGSLTATVGGNDGGNTNTGSGTEGDPFVLTTAGDYVCEFPGGYTPIWYVYTAEADGSLTLSSTYENAWLGVAEDAMTANNTHNEGVGSKSISVTAGTTYYIMVGDWNEADMDVPFTITIA